MKRLWLVLIWFCSIAVGYSQISLMSWNLKDFGNSKTDSSIAFIARTMKPFDIIAIQEVVAGPGGPKAVARLANELNTTGSKWDYIVSDPTSGDSYKRERYAYIWKTSKVRKVGIAHLETYFHIEIDREPFFCTFESDGKNFTLANFHAITKNQQPESEIKYFKFLPEKYPTQNIIFLGDFNCPQSHTVFLPLKIMGYASAFVNQKTSLKKECKLTNCLASEFDNIWYNKLNIEISSATIIQFYYHFGSLKLARTISDHIPVTMTFIVK